MAIIGVAPVRQQQQQQRQPQMSEVDKNLNRILTAVQIANQGFGFALKFDEQDRLQAQTELLERQTAAQPTPEQVQQQSQAQLELTGLKGQREQVGIAKTLAETQKIQRETPTMEQAGQLRKAELDRAQKQVEKLSAEIKNVKDQPRIKQAKTADDLRKEWTNNAITKQTQTGLSAGKHSPNCCVRCRTRAKFLWRC